MIDLFGGEDTPDHEASPQSKGGKARKDALPPERRKQIAQTAAAARWGAQNEDDLIPKVICGSSDRPMRIKALGIEVPCYVIEGERRVFVQRGMVDALGMSRGSAGGGGDRLANFITGERIKPFVPKELSEVITAPIKFRAPNGSIAYGYDAEALHQVCLSILAARREGKLQKQQDHIAVRCELLIAAWSLAGIVSAVDEATGYQYVRAKTAIEDIIDKWLVKELQPWKKQFPVDYYRRVHELNQWPFNPDSAKRPGVVGRWTNDIVYDRLGPGLREQLHDYAGRDEKGRLKHHLYKYLTGNHGIPELKRNVSTTLIHPGSKFRLGS
jgi:hypothetical protein